MYYQVPIVQPMQQQLQQVPISLYAWTGFRKSWFVVPICMLIKEFLSNTVLLVQVVLTSPKVFAFIFQAYSSCACGAANLFPTCAAASNPGFCAYTSTPTYTSYLWVVRTYFSRRLQILLQWQLWGKQGTLSNFVILKLLFGGRQISKCTDLPCMLVTLL